MMDSVQTRCIYCEKQFSRKSNVLKHIRNVHKVQKSQLRDVSRGSFHCLEENCMQSFLYGKDLRNHLKTVHSKFLCERELIFTSIKEFYMWKSDYEEKEKVNFLKRTGNKKLENGDTIYYFTCHRSGQPRKKENSSRIHSNSCKSEFMCTASITVNEKANKSVICTLYENHYGHLKDLGLLRLTDNEKQVVALKLANKMSIDDILKEIRDSFITKSTTSRYDLTSRQDIKNIQRKYQLCEEQRHSNDAISVSLFLNELKLDSEYNPVLAHKFQGENGEDFLRDLNINDIFLAIQHPVQREMLKKFGQNLVCVCVDSTHGTNKYGFNLITLLVVDEHHEGFPVAFCISNKEDKAVLKSFFSLIKQHLPPDFCPQFFMSDDAPAYFNAWVDVFEKSPRKLLCAWHVQRALRLKLRNLIKDAELMCQVYKSLIILLEEKEEEQFQTLWSSIIDLLQFNENVKEFGKYFLKTYGGRITEIAACYRLQAGVNMNMHLESFHRVFKYKFLGSKVNHRLDACIFQLLEFIKNKAVERIRKLERGKLSNKLKMILNRHKISLNLNLCLVENISEDGFKVKSSSCDKEYQIYVNKINCNCHMRCIPCEICIHNASCNCLDFLIRNVICKHIHLVMQKIKAGQSSLCELKFGTNSKNSSKEYLSVGSSTNMSIVSNAYSPNSLEIHTLIQSTPSPINKSIELIQKISSQIRQLDPLTQNKAITKTNRLLSGLSTFLNSQLDLSVHKLPSPTCQTVSIKTQRSFFSAKQKPQIRKNTISKPLAGERDHIKYEILNAESESTDLLNVSSEDHTYSKK